MQVHMQRRPCARHGCRQPARARGTLRVSASQRMVVKGFTLTSPAGWELMKEALREAEVKLLAPQEVIFAQQKGTPIIDVRPEADYDQGHIPGAINIPIYRPITGWDPYRIARRVGYAMFGVLNGTEMNYTFAEEVAAVLQDSSAGAILYCSQGGSLDPVETSKRGRQSRSLVAAYLLTQGTASNINVLKGGYNEWVDGGRDIEVMELVES